MAGGKGRRILLIAAIIVAAFIISVFLLGALLGEWGPHISLEDIVQSIQSFGLGGMLVSMGIMIFHAFVPFPGELVAIANGMAYGALWGSVITWSGAMMGALLAFGLTRRFGRPFVEKMVPEKKLRTVDEWVEKYGSGALIFSRLMPYIAFSLVNYAAGLTAVSWWTFVWTTGVGILPMTVVMSVMGKGIMALPWRIWAIVFAAVILLWMLTHRVLVHRRGASSGKSTSGSDRGR